MADQNNENDSQLFAELEEALNVEDLNRAAAQLQASHPPAIANTLEAFPWERRLQIWQLLAPQTKGAVLIELYEEVQDGLIAESVPDDLVKAVSGLDIDDLADLYKRLPKEVRTAVLQTMDEQRRQRFEAVSRYPNNTAGGLMDVDAIAVRGDATLDAVLRYLRRTRRQQGELPEHMDAVIVVDRASQYMGILSLSDLVSLAENRIVSEVMNTEIKPIPAMTSAKKVARLFEDYDLLSAPVVDEDGKLIGRITVDDVVDVIREEADHTLMSTAGLEEESDMFAPIIPSAKRRAIWLGVNLVNAFIAAWVIGQFENSIEQLVALAVLMPIVASMGGIAGTQTLTLVTRGIALDQVGPSNIGRVLRKELGVISVNALLFALTVAAMGIIWYQNINLGLVFASALTINLLNGAMAGTIIPFALHKLGIDPALAGGVVLMATTDVLGFFTFLGLATFFLL
ncbi:magnesium transporter [Nitrosococcus halophilus Nc 4]|uniref:Magnesium transporter MgtE n=1 Tax=Nitrosococcus halophilus (strain Nc4) TaxID=472759 RepID=D5C083_NITHN|nr:magnesium transporter [Nitrosococcus halophilus]ADE14409.1 magnesium transporter [Nitrosococcus halophilus Nc 4]